MRLSLRRGRFSLGLEGRYDAPISTAMEGVPRGTFTSSIAAGVVTACVHYAWARGCGVFIAGALLRESEGIDVPRSDVAPYLAGGVRVGVSVPLSSSWSIEATGDLVAQSQVVPTVQAAAPITGQGGACLPSGLQGTHVAVWCPPLLAGVASVGALWRLP